MDKLAAAITAMKKSGKFGKYSKKKSGKMSAAEEEKLQESGVRTHSSKKSC